MLKWESIDTFRRYRSIPEKHRNKSIDPESTWYTLRYRYFLRILKHNINMSGEFVKTHCFKTQNKFLVKSGCKKRLWRSLKQILAAERTLPWPNDAVLYYSINAPPTFKPTKKYSDISGLPAPYMDRHSKLFYSNSEEFATVRSLPMDLTAGYLQLRGANTVVG